MIQIFHGDDADTHDAFQAWRRAHPDGFHLSEGPKNLFTAHWTQDRRENALGRGCAHQGTSDRELNDYFSGCYTKAMKVCSEDFRELASWANARGAKVKPCFHCDSKSFPLPLPPSTPSAQATSASPAVSRTQSPVTDVTAPPSHRALDESQALQLLSSYYFANKNHLPSNIRIHREAILKLLMDGVPPEIAFRRVVAKTD